MVNKTQRYYTSVSAVVVMVYRPDALFVVHADAADHRIGRRESRYCILGLQPMRIWQWLGRCWFSISRALLFSLFSLFGIYEKGTY
jgi:hypothetical protein